MDDVSAGRGHRTQAVETVTEPVADEPAPVEPVAEVVEAPAEPVAAAVEEPVEPVVEAVDEPVEPVVEAVRSRPQPVWRPSRTGRAGGRGRRRAGEPVVEAVEEPVADAVEQTANTVDETAAGRRGR